MKQLFALCTTVSFLVSVGQQVLLQLSSKKERFAALYTDVLLFSIVDKHVLLQIINIFKGLHAL